MREEDIKTINADNIREHIIPYTDKSKIDLENDMHKLIKILSQCSNLINKSELTDKYLHGYLINILDSQIKTEDTTLNAPYVEAQQGLGCGRHAMNNLLGKTQFIVTASENTEINYKNPPSQIDTRSLCNQVNKDIAEQTGVTDNYLECKSCEDYNAPLFVAALGLVGYKMEIASMLKNKFMMYRFIKNWKIIINYGGGHWVCAKNDNDRYIFVDSVGSTYLTYGTFDELISRHISDTNQLFLVTFEGQLIDPVNPYVFRNVVEECEYNMFDKVLYKGEEYSIIEKRYDYNQVDGFRKCSNFLISKTIIVGEDKSKFTRISTGSLITHIPGKKYPIDNTKFGFNAGDELMFKGKKYKMYVYGNIGDDKLFVIHTGEINVPISEVTKV